ncbi:hypothetical protein ACFL2T_06420 [Elusimicrobiota bacterium]
MNPRNNPILLAAVILAVSIPAFSQVSSLQDLRTAFPEGFEAAELSRGDLPVPPEVPRPVEIAVYETDEEFPFESRAREAMEVRLAAIRNAGITTLGGRVSRKPNRRYTFVIEYLPTLESSAGSPPPVLLRTYKAAAVYWRESDAEQALASASANIANAGLTVLGGAVVDVGRDNSFEIEFIMPNKLRRTRKYQARIERYRGGRFTFESRAEAAIPEYIARFSRAGVPVLRGKAVRRPDRDYSVELEYVTRTNEYGPRPEFAIARYDSRDTFSFDHQAIEAARQRLPLFAKAGAPPVHGFAREVDRDYSFSVDYIVRNLYLRDGTEPSVTIKVYQAVETYDFERRAETAMAEKVTAFNNAGFTVVGSRVVEVGRDYSYVLDYITKTEPPRDRAPRR